MVKSIILDKPCKASEMEFKQVKLKPLQNGEVRIRHAVIGINFMDIEDRRGQNSISFPFCPGYEACGYIEETKGDVGNLKAGDRVAYATIAGAYCEERNINHKHLIGLPDIVTNEQTAAILFKAITAHYLVTRTFAVQSGMYVLVHAAAGGVGMLITQLAKHLGAKIIGTVGSDAKIDIAARNGCDYVINYNKDDFSKEVLAITKNVGVNVVYDSVGIKTFAKSIDCLCTFGLMVAFGNSSGRLAQFDLAKLTKNSLFVTTPSIFKYKANHMELILSATEVFNLLSHNIIRDNINLKYSFDEISTAHQDMEDRRTVGASIVVL